MESQHFSYDSYVIRRQVLKFIGAAFHIYNQNEELAFYVNQKGFKLKEDIRVFTDETMSQEVISIKSRNIIDISATYDVIDSSINEKVGSLRRKGLKSILKDEWVVLDAYDNEIGNIKEDNIGLALLRRFIGIIPQSFVGKVNDNKAFTLKQNFNPFVLKINLDFLNNSLDKRLGIAASILISSIEGRQG